MKPLKYLFFVYLFLFSCNTNDKKTDQSETLVPPGIEDITDISLSLFRKGPDTMWHETVSKLNKTDYLALISIINSSDRTTPVKANMPVEIRVSYSDRKQVTLMSNALVFTKDNHTFYSWKDTLLLHNYLYKIIKPCAN